MSDDNTTKRDNNIDFDKISSDMIKLQASFTSLRTDLDKLKSVLSDKVSKSMFAEIESKINLHTKTLDSHSKKIFELENNVNTFTQQPISHSVIDAIRKQLSDEILTKITEMIDVQNEKTTKLIEDKNNETRLLINNAKKFMYR